jgi:hypothetical protein
MTEPRDIEAWKLAIVMMRESNEPVYVNNVDGKLSKEGLAETGKWAASAMQSRSLRLEPWRVAPCEIKDADIEEILRAGPDDQDIRDVYGAAVLRKRMQLNGVSRWHPDPVRALEGHHARAGAAAKQ